MVNKKGWKIYPYSGANPYLIRTEKGTMVGYSRTKAIALERAKQYSRKTGKHVNVSKEMSYTKI